MVCDKFLIYSHSTRIRKLNSFFPRVAEKDLSEDTICYPLTIDLLDIEDESFDSKQHTMLQLCNIVFVFHVAYSL